MLETIREYGQDRLEEAGETTEARERHAGWFLELAEASATGLVGFEQGRWLQRMKAEQDNLRVALAWSVAEQPEVGLRLSAALLEFWMIRARTGKPLCGMSARSGREEWRPTGYRLCGGLRSPDRLWPEQQHIEPTTGRRGNDYLRKTR